MADHAIDNWKSDSTYYRNREAKRAHVLVT
jgi:hypothetical protein